MPFLDINQAKIHYQESGSGDETIVFSHGLLMSSEMFREQVEILGEHYRCVSFDHRGQGRSEVTQHGYDMDSLAKDAAALIQTLDCGPCHFVGLSMGGFVGMRLALRHPELLRSLTLMNTSADAEPEQNKGPYRRLAFVGRWLGFRWVVKPIMKIMFGTSFLSDPQREQQKTEWRQRLLSLDRVGTSRAAHGVIDRKGVYEQLSGLTTPTLILAGAEDVATTQSKSERIHSTVAGSQLVTIPRAGHSSSIEEPEAVTKSLLSFFTTCG